MTFDNTDGNFPEGTADVQSALDFLGATSKQVVWCGTGCAYTTLAAAVAAITDAGSSKRYVIALTPETFSGDVEIPDYVSLQGCGYGATILSGTLTFAASHQCDVRGCQVTAATLTNLLANTVVTSDLVENAQHEASTYNMTPDVVSHAPVKFAEYVTGAEIHTDGSAGNVAVDVWVAASDAIPTATDTIVASAHPALSGAQKAAATVTTWTRAIAAGSRIAFAIESSPTPTVTHVAVVVYVRRARVVL